MRGGEGQGGTFLTKGIALAEEFQAKSLKSS